MLKYLSSSWQQFWHHSVLCRQRPRPPGITLLETVQAFSQTTCTEETKDFKSRLNQFLVALTLTLCCDAFLALSGTYLQRRSSGLYSRPREKLIPCTIPMMMGCQATRYLSQSSSCPYRTCVFSQLAGDEAVKESAQIDER